MSLFAELLDIAHHRWVCQKKSKLLLRRFDSELTQSVVGEATVDETLIAPLSHSRVLGYRIIIEIPAHYWMNRRVVVDCTKVAPFELKTTEGQTLHVDTPFCHLINPKPCLKGVRAAAGDESQRFPEEVAQVLADRAQLKAEASDTKRYEWMEFHLHGDEELWLNGVVSDEKISGDPHHPLILSTIPPDELKKNILKPDRKWLRMLPHKTVNDRSSDLT